MSTPRAPEPLPFSMRESPRATRMRMVVYASGLEVVVPRGTRHEQAAQFVEANRAWAERTLLKICGRVPTPPRETFSDLPLFSQTLSPQLPERIDIIDLRSIGTTYDVAYVRVPMLRNCATLFTPPEPHHTQLIVYCADPSAPPFTTVAVLFREWLREKAKDVLPNFVNAIADEVRLKRPTQTRIGFQRTIWGSRSSSGRISLNAPLLFLPPELLRHVIVHELCHTVHMNHGEKFKCLLRTLDPHADHLEKALGKAGIYIPGWIHS